MAVHRAGITCLAISIVYGHALAMAPIGLTLADNFLNGVVRIGDTVDGSRGSGSIINKWTGANGAMYLCILTADHVVADHPANIAVDIGSGTNAASTFADPLLPGTMYRASGPVAAPNPNADLAVFGVTFTGTVQQFNALVKLSVGVGLANAGFSVIGYGNTAALYNSNGVIAGYQETAGTYGQKRFMDNTNTGINPAFSWVNGAITYTFEDYQYVLDYPGEPGEGFTFRGDSGGPFLGAQGVISDYGMSVKTDSIGAVVSFGPVGTVPWGSIDHGCRITAPLQTWIGQRCAAVPEPASIAILGLGLVALLRRRREAK